MDKDYAYYRARIREAERLRSQALGDLLADGWAGMKKLAIRAYHAVVALARPHHPLHH